MRDWISVDDRLPKEPSLDIIFEQNDYIVTDGLNVGFCDFQRGSASGSPWATWGAYGDLHPEDITHWQPMPEPPK